MNRRRLRVVKRFSTEAEKEYQRQYYAKNREEKRRKSREYKRAREEKYAACRRVYAFRVKLRVFAAYGNRCECCGEDNPLFLGIDHIEGGGRQHTIALGGGGMNFYLWLVRNEFPKGFQVLCHNCNIAKGVFSICPHKLAFDPIRMVLERKMTSITKGRQYQKQYA